MANTFELIETKTISTTTVSTITFSSIPGTYQDLKLYIRAQAESGSNYLDLRMRFNGDTSTQYGQGELTGTGGSGFSSAFYNYSNSFINIPLQGTVNTGVTYATYEIDLLGYSTAGRVKVGTGNVTLSDYINPGTNLQFRLQDYLWDNTSAAMTSITFFTSTDVFRVGSVFSLYGIKKS
jgi:hypothetical protein